jgi:hypothetical protein
MADDKLTPAPEKALTPPPTLDTLGDIEGVKERPKSIDPTDRSGKEGITADEIRLPRLTVAQGLHPQLVPGQTEHIPGLSIGQMFNDVTEEVYGTGPLKVVSIYRYVTWIEFDPNDRNVVLDRHIPPGDPRREWSRGTGPDGEDEAPRATEFVEFVCLLLRPNKLPERLVVPIKTTNKQMRAAAELWTTYIDNRNGPIYSGLYQLTSQMIRGKNKKGQDTLYGVFVVKNAGYIPKDTPAGAMLFEYAKHFHLAAKGKPVVADRAGGTDDVAVDDTSFDPEELEAQG